jgi:hypothetical protein
LIQKEVKITVKFFANLQNAVSNASVYFWRKTYFDLLRPLTCRERFSTYTEAAGSVSTNRIVKIAFVSVFAVVLLGLVGDGQNVRRTYSAESCWTGIIPIFALTVLSMLCSTAQLLPVVLG